MPYRIEYAKSNRALCKGACKTRIEKDVLRFASISDSAGFAMTAWRHFPECMTDRIKANVLGAEGGVGSIEGLEELEPADQKMVRDYFASAAAAEEEKKAPKAKSKKSRGPAASTAEEDGDEESPQKPQKKTPSSARARAPKSKKQKVDDDDE